MVSKQASRNGHAPSGGRVVSSASDLFNVSHRRQKVVNVTPDAEEPTNVLVRSMSAGERRRFLAKMRIPAPTEEDPNATTANIPWWTSGDRVRCLLALTCANEDGTDLFPAAAKAARLLLQGNDTLHDDLLEIDQIDTVAEELLEDAANNVALITQAAVNELHGIKAPLAPTSESSSTSQSQSESPTPA